MTVNLADLLFEYGSQKNTKRTAHYAELYERYTPPDSVSVMMEIGVAEGGSLRAWADYVGSHNPHPEIHGVDKKPTWERYSGPGPAWIELSSWIHLHVIDQSDSKALLATFGDISFDLIIDDAGHRMEPQQHTFETLWPLVSPGGWYVIEDLHTSYWPLRDGGFRRKGTTVEFLKNLIDCPTHWAYLYSDRAGKQRQRRKPTMFERTISELHFHDSIVFIRKGHG